MIDKTYTVPLLPDSMVAIIRKYAPKKPRHYPLSYDLETYS